MFKKHFNLVAAVALALWTIGWGSAAPAQEWGSIKGRMLVDGTPKKPAPLVVSKDQFCIAAKPVNDSLVVGKENELANVVVYLRVATGKPTVAVHPDYADALAKPVPLDNKNCMFSPHIVVVRKGQTLEVTNSDPVGHNTNISTFAFNQLIPAMGNVPIKVSQVSAVPTPVVCNIHPWMKGYVLPLDHPYAAVTGQDGVFEIKNIPVGEHEFQFWQDSGYLKNLKFKGGATDARGRAKIKVVAGETLDLGDIKVPAANLK